ncbi:c-type cytochrome [Sneathiella aquimaris]|uniref:c-type cytochrome n=1 Tax=Sneathiella aquimaris TaxID=2599305 RepID=UPI001FEC7374|nr:cytochrome c family protein [Sneathiella aquimaris]
MKSSMLLACGTAIVMTLAASTAMAAGDAKKGEKVFKKCKACHTVDEGGKNKIGPNLFGVVGKKAGTHDGFKYSKAMKEADITWDAATLDAFLKKPKKYLKGTKMSFAGLKKDSQRQNVIAYLETLK